jgi:hypothetical protein
MVFLRLYIVILTFFEPHQGEHAMKNRFVTVAMLLVMLVSLASNAQADTHTGIGLPALVYVPLVASDDLARFATTHLPLYAHLEGGLLTAANPAGQQALREAGLSFQVLDSALGTGAYYLASRHDGIPTPDFDSYGQVMLKTRQGVLLYTDASRANALSQAGAELQAISLTPKPLPTHQAQDVFPDEVIPDPLIQNMIDQVSETQVYTYDRQLAGELPVWVDSSWYTIPTRNTNSGTPIQKATSYVGQHMASLGMDVDYHVWSNNTNPDVIGEMPGMVNPDDIFIIGAHIDDVNGTPGADDNASGSVATLMAADILSQFQWGCTLRFAFWTGEEQGLLGSGDYAQEAFSAGENILGYLNLDMIAWNTLNSAPTIYLGYDPAVAHSLELANLFAEVVSAYNIDLDPLLGTDFRNSSDHGSFLDYGFPAILGIEGYDDFNPYYHGPQDTPAHTDPMYFTNYVRASLATYAHMSGCLIPSGVGHLNGHVTAADSHAPIQDARVTATDDAGHRFPTFTDETGYYTRTLLSGTYTVTASAYGYLPFMVSGVSITSDTVTTQDFSLLSAPTYVVSGTVTESNTGLPLLAEISFDGSPTTVWSDPATGFYHAELPINSYTMHVRSGLHRPQERAILLDQDQTQDFTLDPLPCILLVDDDQDDPDVNGAYTGALDGLGLGYDIWDTSAAGDPSIQDISGYRKLIWYTGYPYNNTFNTSNENTVSSYLDSGGNFFLSSQDYLYEMHTTPFNQNYLHILSYQNDVSQLVVTGQNAFSGLGPYTLSYPFTNYSDVVNPDGQAQTAFSGNQGNAAISYAGNAFKTVFFGYPFEAIPQAADRQAVMSRLLEFFGSCQAQPGWLDGHVTDAATGDPLQGVSVQAVPSEEGGIIQSITDPNGYYTMTLPAGEYLVWAELDGFDTQSHLATILAGQGTTLDFVMLPTCVEPVTGLRITWAPLEIHAGDVITFTATASGTLPIHYSWDFGDGQMGTGATVTHTYAEPGIYDMWPSASNSCSGEDFLNRLTVRMGWSLFLPSIDK